AIERARRAEELQKQIQEQLAQLQQQKKLESSKVMMDAKGNLVDENGNIIRLPSRPVATFLANKNRQKEQKKKGLKIEKLKTINQKLKRSEFVDENIPTPKFIRKKKKLNFVEPGKYIQQSAKLKAFKAKKLAQQELAKKKREEEIQKKKEELRQKGFTDEEIEKELEQ